MGLTPIWLVSLQKGEIWTLDTHTHLDGKKYEDPGRRWPSTSQEGKPETHPSVTIPRRNQFCLHLDFGLLASSRTMKELFSIVFKSQSLSLICYENSRKQIYIPCNAFGFRALLRESHISIIREPSCGFNLFV